MKSLTVFLGLPSFATLEENAADSFSRTGSFVRADVNKSLSSGRRALVRGTGSLAFQPSGHQSVQLLAFRAGVRL
jgi:hypothetical protein